MKKKTVGYSKNLVYKDETYEITITDGRGLILTDITKDVVRDGKVDLKYFEGNSDIYNILFPFDPIHELAEKEYEKIDKKYEFLKVLPKQEESL